MQQHWNSSATRVPKYSPTQRWDGQEPPSRKTNQYTKLTLSEQIDRDYRWLITKTTVAPQDSLGIINCSIPNGEGIDITEANYTRMGFRGDKVMCHVFSWNYFNPGQIIPATNDVSHLCGNSKCCKPSHLHLEPHSVNIGRIACPGFIVIPITDTENHCFQICNHTPHCKKYQIINLANQSTNIVRD